MMDGELLAANAIIEAISTLSFLEAWLQDRGEDELAHRAGYARDRLQAIGIDAELSEDID